MNEIKRQRQIEKLRLFLDNHAKSIAATTFLVYRKGPNTRNKLVKVGTAFLYNFSGVCYLITAHHVIKSAYAEEGYPVFLSSYDENFSELLIPGNSQQEIRDNHLDIYIVKVDAKFKKANSRRFTPLDETDLTTHLQRRILFQTSGYINKKNRKPLSITETLQKKSELDIQRALTISREPSDRKICCTNLQWGIKVDENVICEQNNFLLPYSKFYDKDLIELSKNKTFNGMSGSPALCYCVDKQYTFIAGMLISKHPIGDGVALKYLKFNKILEFLKKNLHHKMN